MPKDDCACAVQDILTQRQNWLFIWPPAGPTIGKLKSFLRDQGLEATVVEGGYKVEMPGDKLSPLLQGMEAIMTEGEGAQTRTLLLDEDREPGFADFAHVMALPELVGRMQGDWLVELVGEGALDTDFQPIVHAQNPSMIFAHECLLRANGADGIRQGAGPILESAQNAGLSLFLDRAARTTHVRNADEKGVTSRIFINFLPSTIYDPSHCLRTTFDAINRTGLAKEQFVFEVIESEKIDDLDHLSRVLDEYRDKGFQVALDDVGAGYLSLNMLPHLRPDYVKIDKDLITNVHNDRVRSVIVERLIDLAMGLDIEVIAEGVESKQEFQWLAAKGVDYIQGYYIARPNAMPQRMIDFRQAS